MGGILEGKRILVAGVTMDSSIGFATAKVAQEQGATVLISNFGRALGITRRIARRLPTEPPVLELDVTDDHAPGGPRRPGPRARRRARRRRALDRLRQPETLLGGKFLDGPWPDVAQAVQVSAYSLMSLTQACRPLMASGGSVVGLTFDATVAWPAYDWMGVAKAGLESCSRYLARDLGPAGIRVNLVSRRPAQDAGREGDPRLRGPGVDVERPGLRWAGTTPTTSRPRRPCARCSGPLPGHDRRDRARGRRLARDGGLTQRRRCVMHQAAPWTCIFRRLERFAGLARGPVANAPLRREARCISHQRPARTLGPVTSRVTSQEPESLVELRVLEGPTSTSRARPSSSPSTSPAWRTRPRTRPDVSPNGSG